jgi:hypothetical protein
MTIHTIGDSHSYSGWENVVNHYLGPILCYSFGNDPFNRCNISTFSIEEGDTVVFCLGEIDCRCHIHKHVSESSTYQSIIDNIVDNYLKSVKALIDSLRLNLKVCIYNVVPAVIKDTVPENGDYPYLGDDETRRNYILYFNTKLNDECKKYKYLFFDVYDKYTNNGFLNKELSDGFVHIRDGSHIKEFIRHNEL